MISYMKRNSTEFTNLSEFEFSYADDILNRADALVGTKKYEFKSWTPNQPYPWNDFFNGTGGSYTQFIRYLQNTSNFADLKYVFNANKASEAIVKGKFKDLFILKAEEIYNSKPSLFNQLDRIGGGKVSSPVDFVELTNHSTFTTNNILFNFIISQ